MKYMKRIVTLVCLLMVVILIQTNALYAAEKTTVTFWHAMGGWRTAVIKRMAADFNLLHPVLNEGVTH